MSSKERWKIKIPFALTAIADIESFLKDISREEFLQDRLRFMGVERCLEIIGEAVNHLPAQIRDRYPSIPWVDIYNMRNILAHGYDTVDADIVWETATGDLGDLKNVLLTIMNGAPDA